MFTTRIPQDPSDYAARLSRVLSSRYRKPFRLAGLRLYADLLALLGSLEVSLTHLADEPRLTCFADGIREAFTPIQTSNPRNHLPTRA